MRFEQRLNPTAASDTPVMQHLSRNLVADTGHHAPELELGSAIDIFQTLAAAKTRSVLFQRMLGLALDYALGPDAYLLLRGVDGYYLAARASSLHERRSGDSAAGLPYHITRALIEPPRCGTCKVTGHDGESGIIVPLSTQEDERLGYLCIAQRSEPRPACLSTLLLIAACGAGVLDNLPEPDSLAAHDSDMSERATDLAAENEELRSQVKIRLALASFLSDERSLLRTLIDNMPDRIYVKDTSGRFVIANTAAALGMEVKTPEDLIGKSDLEFYPLEVGQRFFVDEQEIMRTGQPLIDKIEENINYSGVRRWFSTTKVQFKDENENVIGIVGMSRDVTMRVDAEEALRLRNRAIELSLDGIVITNCLLPGNPVVYVNPAFERITGYALDEARQRGIACLLEDAADQAATDELLVAMREQTDGRTVLRSRRKDGETFWNEVRVAPVRDRTSNATHFIFTMTDITKARNSEEQLERMASHDALTGLPNRRMLMERLSQAIALGQRGNFVVAVAFIDLDRLKFVNDTYGHEAGDVLLQAVATRMASCVRKTDTVARLGGDEFVLISLHSLHPDPGGGVSRAAASPGNYSYVGDMLAKVQALLGEPILLGNEQFCVTCSIGVSIFPQDGHNAENLLKNADAAMYQAKKNGRNMIRFHDGLPPSA